MSTRQLIQREITEAEVDALREGDLDLLPYLVANPQAIHRTPAHIRQGIVVALLAVIGESRSAFTSGVKKESAVAMRAIINVLQSPASLESAAEMKLMIRTLGVEEMRKLKLDRHLLSAKDDVAPAAVEFVKVVSHILRCDPREYVSGSAAIAKLEQSLQSLRSGASGQVGNQAEAPPRRTQGEAPVSERNAPLAAQGAHAASADTSTQQQGATTGGGGGAHRVRSLPSKPSSVPHEQNPLFDGTANQGLMPIHCPNPVLSFAKHFGLGCIPRIPKYNEGTSLTLAPPVRKQSTVANPGSEDLSTPGSTGPQAQNSRGWGSVANLAQVSAQMRAQAEQSLAQANNLTSPTLAPQSAPSGPPPALSGAPRSPVRSDRQETASAPSSPPRVIPPQHPPAVAEVPRSAATQPTPIEAPLQVVASPASARSTPRTPPPSTIQQSEPPPPVAPSPPPPQPSAPTFARIAIPPPLEPGTPAHDLVKRYLSTADGVIVGWGQNRCGELGLNTVAPVATPRVISVPQKIINISCGAQYSLWLTKSGQIFSSGAAEWGQLGIGDPGRLTELCDGIPICSNPTPIRAFKSQDVISDLCAGYAFAVAVTENGELYLWGNNNHGQCSLGSQLKPENVRVIQPTKVGMRATRVLSVACGSFFVVILTATNTVLSWGLVSVLGLGPEEEVLKMIDKKWCAESLSREKRNIVLCPCKISALDGKCIVQICAGQWHVVAVGSDGAVYSWGVGHQGRLGHGVATQESRPRKIEGLNDAVVTQAACGSFHSCVLSKEGRVFVFGDNANGQCGAGSQPFYLSPQLLPLPAPATYIACGREHTSVLLADGDVMVCGSSMSTGSGLGTGSKLIGPTRVLTNFITLSLHCGISHSFALGVARALELVPIGMLHAGPASKITSMMLKDGLISAALGASFTVVVNRNGETFAFGNGDWGQLGMGSTTALLEKSPVDNLPVVLHPQRIPELSAVRVASVAAGYAFALAISEQQKVYFWGNNNHSQGGLGQSMRLQSRIESPTEIVALSDKNVVQIACGSFFVLALTSTSEVYSWGIADCCGHGKDPTDLPANVMTTSTSTEQRAVIAEPVRIQSISGVITIAAGQWHALALTDKGYIYAWGIGHQGRLGTGDTVTRYTPTKLSFTVPTVSLGCGSFHSWALSVSGDLYMWGDNDSGQCGSDGSDTILIPQQVMTGVRGVSCGRQHSVVVTNDGKVRMAGLLTHQDRQYKCKTFDAQPQPPPLIGLAQAGKFALQTFCGPHHTFVLAEKERPSAAVVSDACADLRIATRRANLTASPSPTVRPPTA